jgi:hypothetical protein
VEALAQRIRQANHRDRTEPAKAIIGAPILGHDHLGVTA